MKTAEEFCKSVGGKVQGGMNWIWAVDMPVSVGPMFISFLEKEGYEHRGIYPDPNGTTIRVRYR